MIRIAFINRISLFGAIVALGFFATFAVAEETPLDLDDLKITVENKVGQRIDVVRIRVKFAFKTGVPRTGYAVLYDLEPGGKATVNLTTSTAKTSLSVVRVETTIDLESGKTSRRVVREEQEKDESKEGVTAGKEVGDAAKSRTLEASDLPKITDVYVSQVNVFELKKSGARRKKVAKLSFGSDDEHSGVRNRSYSIVENEDGGSRKYIVKPKGTPELVKRKESKPQ